MRIVARALCLLLAAPLLPAALAGGPAQGAVQPCTVSYTRDGGGIRPGPDPDKDHSWLPVNIPITDTRVVTDIDITADLTHPDANGLVLHLLSPQTVTLAPTIQAMNTNQTTGSMDGNYTFDEEVGAAEIAGANPAPGTYRPATAENILEGHPAAGDWSLWVLNYSASAGTIRSFTLTLTYATCDSDGDGVEDSADNCPTVPNDQANHDSDALGDACDLDMDGDRLANDVDGCPVVAATNSTGCPSATRKARLRYLKGKNRIKVTITSPVAACKSGARVKLWRVRRHRDFKLLVGTARKSGRYRFKAPRGARYYVTVSPSYASGIAECGKATSRKVRVPRRRHK